MTFSIPAIDNKLEVLAQRLGIAEDNDLERSNIVVLGEQDGVHHFNYLGEVYSVARLELLPGVDTAVEYNSNWYAIQKKDAGL